MSTESITEVLKELTISIEKGTYYSDNIDGNHFTVIKTKLEDAGFKTAQAYSKCEVATQEGHWSKGSIRAEVLVSRLFGVFTEVRLTGRS